MDDQLAALVSVRIFVPDLAKRLAGVPAETLADIVLDRSERRWVREKCACALLDRVPAGRRAALAESDLNGAIARTILDGPDVPALVVLAADAWTHRRTVGEQLLDAVIDVRGLPAVLAPLGASSPEELMTGGASPTERLLGTRLTHLYGGDVTPALADPVTMVARAAHDVLVDSEGFDDELRAMTTGPGRLWALAVLAGRGEPVDGPAIPLPTVPDDVRAAIVRQYTPGQRDTDPRWLIEAASNRTTAPDEEEILRQAIAALVGLNPREPVSAHDEHQQGDGTYHTVATDAGRATISTLGPFFAATDNRVTKALRDNGFRHIDATIGDTVFTGLHVYYFGDRNPLAVSTLLFYWQD
ncbi:hypothetical protein EV193_11873 [Herbihabitans rhizosphaerae]|uniref:Uncharacterized protein n=1 Tax=Herbihabitans rhizosphaerae TaxID=1872711 RepID=A0A4Q7KDX6_9PSEU|nr:hypothetical protein [Herbihabitans rhizosphaerae]RZS29819.1 hypothetical protein EV193_11873 [Herbihabitans rhizosphaerae]